MQHLVSHVLPHSISLNPHYWWFQDWNSTTVLAYMFFARLLMSLQCYSYQNQNNKHVLDNLDNHDFCAGFIYGGTGNANEKNRNRRKVQKLHLHQMKTKNIKVHYLSVDCVVMEQTKLVEKRVSKKHMWGFPWCRSGQESSANAKDTGSIPGLGRRHMPRSEWACVPQLPEPARARALELHLLSPWAVTTKAHTPRACTPQQEKSRKWKACALQQRVDPARHC